MKSMLTFLNTLGYYDLKIYKAVILTVDCIFGNNILKCAIVMINNYMPIGGRAIAQAVSRWLPTAAARFKPGSSHVGFVVDKVALRKGFSENFGFPCQYSFHQFLHNHHHLSSGAGTIGQ
jgi:hypothetical protein